MVKKISKLIFILQFLLLSSVFAFDVYQAKLTPDLLFFIEHINKFELFDKDETFCRVCQGLKTPSGECNIRMDFITSYMAGESINLLRKMFPNLQIDCRTGEIILPIAQSDGSMDIIRAVNFRATEIKKVFPNGLNITVKKDNYPFSLLVEVKDLAGNSALLVYNVVDRENTVKVKVLEVNLVFLKSSEAKDKQFLDFDFATKHAFEKKKLIEIVNAYLSQYAEQSSAIDTLIALFFSQDSRQDFVIFTENYVKKQKQ